jgi:hypothetical protein
MENAETSTDPNKIKEAQTPQGLSVLTNAMGLTEEAPAHPYAIKITWQAIVDRMVQYLKAHNFDKDESNCIRIVTAFRFHLVKARCTDDGAEVHTRTPSLSSSSYRTDPNAFSSVTSETWTTRSCRPTRTSRPS